MCVCVWCATAARVLRQHIDRLKLRARGVPAAAGADACALPAETYTPDPCVQTLECAKPAQPQPPKPCVAVQVVAGVCWTRQLRTGRYWSLRGSAITTAQASRMNQSRTDAATDQLEAAEAAAFGDWVLDSGRLRRHLCLWLVPWQLCLFDLDQV